MPQDDPYAAIAKPVADDPYAAIAQPATSTTPPPGESTLKKVGRGAALGAFEGVGVTPATTPGEVVSGSIKNFGKGVKDFVSDVYRRNQGGPTTTPMERIVATGLDVIPAFIDRTATSLEKGGREAIEAGKRGDYEEAAEKGASTLTSAALLRSGGKAATEEGLSDVGKLRVKAKSGIQPIARKVTGVETAVKESVGKAAEKQGEALAKHETTADNVANRERLTKDVDQQSVQFHGKLKQVEQAVGKEANAKFNAVRDKLGITKDNPGPELPPDELIAAVKDAETSILQGIPENIKEFRSILGHEAKAFSDELAKEISETTPEDFGQELAGDKPFTWDKLQSLKSRLDAKLRARGRINGDVKRALLSTREVVVDQMGKIAEPGGAAPQWAEARNFWRNYKQDFHEPTGLSGSGSPVAQSLDALDPKNIRQPFLRTQSSVGNRGIDTLRKYDKFGGKEAADHATKIISGHEELQNAATRPKGFDPNKTPDAPTVDINKVAKEAIAKRAARWGDFNARDIGIIGSSVIGGFLENLFRGGGYELPIAVGTYEGAKFGAARAMNNPRVIEWLAKTPQAEIDVLQKIPGADKVKIVDGLTQVAIQQAKTGKPPVLSQQVRQLLGPVNVRRIIAANANIPKTAGEAKERLAATPVGP